MQKHFRNPLAGGPRTIETIDRTGKPRFKISPCELTPLRAKVADRLAFALALVLLLRCVVLYFDTPDYGVWEAVGFIGLFIAGRHLLRWMARDALRCKTEIVMTVDGIAVRRWLCWQRYNRLLEHRFAVQVHDRAEDEYRKQDFAARKAAKNGNVVLQQPYYQASFHVILVYAGQRVDLVSVFGAKEAAAIVTRLQYCDRLLNEAIAMSGGISKRPEDDWAEAPGGMRHG